MEELARRAEEKKAARRERKQRESQIDTVNQTQEEQGGQA